MGQFWTCLYGYHIFLLHGLESSICTKLGLHAVMSHASRVLAITFSTGGEVWGLPHFALYGYESPPVSAWSAAIFSSVNNKQPKALFFPRVSCKMQAKISLCQHIYYNKQPKTPFLSLTRLYRLFPRPIHKIKAPQVKWSKLGRGQCRSPPNPLTPGTLH